MWYYRLGGNTFGPVAWREIEELLGDTLDPEDLLVARAGDAEWRSADAVMAEFENGAPENDEQPQDGETAPRPLHPDHGLGRWIAQGTVIVLSAPLSFIGAQLVARLFGTASLGILSAPLIAGMYAMCFERFNGNSVSIRGIVEGFRFVLPAIAVAALTTALPMALFHISTSGPVYAIFEEAFGAGASRYLPALAYFLVAVPINAAAFYAMPLVVDQGMSGWAALKASWAKVRGRYWSHIGMTVTLLLLHISGILALGIGTLLTGPIALAAKACAYRYHFGSVADLKGQDR